MTIDNYYIFASSVSALIARFLTYPMDTIKTRLQTSYVDYETIDDVNTTTTTTRQDEQKAILRRRQFLSLYSGLIITLIFSVPALTTYLCFYELTKDTLDHHTSLFKKDNLINHAISGTVAEMTAGLFFTPMEVIKSQMQIKTSYSTRYVISMIQKEDGLKGFFKGYWLSLAVFLPHTITYFVVYEQLKSMINVDGNISFFGFLFCSAVASCLGVIVSTPFDVIKTRWQVSAQEEAYRVGPLQITKQMWLDGGMKYFTKGMLARIGWGIPTTTISMTLFETLLDAHK